MISMDKNDFFIKDNDTKTFDVHGESFVYKVTDANDELSWIDDYTYEVEEEYVTDEGEKKKRVVSKINRSKLAKCKLRNIIQIPYTREEIKEICGINKEFKDFTRVEKDVLFGKLNPNIMDLIIKKIDGLNSNKKKS